MSFVYGIIFMAVMHDLKRVEHAFCFEEVGPTIVILTNSLVYLRPFFYSGGQEVERAALLEPLDFPFNASSVDIVVGYSYFSR